MRFKDSQIKNTSVSLQEKRAILRATVNMITKHMWPFTSNNVKKVNTMDEKFRSFWKDIVHIHVLNDRIC